MSEQKALLYFLGIWMTWTLASAPLARFAIGQGERSRVIDFEDAVVEGVNKKPLDSYSQLADANKRGQGEHLYRKRGGFRTETRETLREMSLK